MGMVTIAVDLPYYYIIYYIHITIYYNILDTYYMHAWECKKQSSVGEQLPLGRHQKLIGQLPQALQTQPFRTIFLWHIHGDYTYIIVISTMYLSYYVSYQ